MILAYTTTNTAAAPLLPRSHLTVQPKFWETINSLNSNFLYFTSALPLLLVSVSPFSSQFSLSSSDWLLLIENLIFKRQIFGFQETVKTTRNWATKCSQIFLLLAGSFLSLDDSFFLTPERKNSFIFWGFQRYKIKLMRNLWNIIILSIHCKYNDCVQCRFCTVIFATVFWLHTL